MRNIRLISSILILVIWNCFFALAGNVSEKVIVDLTKAIVEDTKKDYLLGPTGARGWMHVREVPLTPQDLTADMSTAFARQILVTQVEKGSPANGVLAVGDVILGIDEKPFGMDPRKALGYAINEAEKTENKGVLKLLRWRPNTPNKKNATERSKGKKEVVSLALKVLGTYSDTAPYDCPKSQMLYEQTIAAVYREELNSRLGIWALALLATGEDKHIVKATSYIMRISSPDPKRGIDALNGAKSWAWGYQLIILCEYHFLTGDKSVLPTIKELAVILSKGQSNTGAWGHYMAQPSYNDGRLHGRLEGYAALNQPSLICFIALVLAQKCGVEHSELTEALRKSNLFFGHYIDKGAIPYGYHMPIEYVLSNNGTSATAAFAFALQENRKGATFFSSLCGGAATKVEIGHTGAFFNSMWTGLGANLSGPEVYSGYFKDWTWLRTMTRKWNGGYVFQRAGGGAGKYSNIGPSSAMLLHFCIPRRMLFITGKEQDKSIWKSGKEAEAVVGIRAISYTQKKPEQLLGLLGSDAPLVRRRAADELATRNGEFIDKLVLMLKGSRNEKIGACHALTKQKEKAAPAIKGLMTIFRNSKEDLWLRHHALYAFSQIGEPARVHVPELLEMLAGNLPKDQRRHLELYIAWAITGLAEKPYAEKYNKDLVFTVARKLLAHPHMRGRIEGMKFIQDIGLEDFHLFAAQIIHVIRNKDPEYYTYHYDRPAKFGLELLERLNIKEGMELCVETIYPGIWGQYYRIKGKHGRLAYIQRYGANAKSFIPLLKKLKLGAAGDEAIKAIEKSTVTRELLTIKEAIKAGVISKVKNK